jgi:serine/threonine protein phosphatase 1
MVNRRIFAIGDVHGEATKLRKLLRKLKFEAGLCKDDILVQLGDLVDRGPNVKRCVEILLEQEQKMECHWIRGNHEVMMMQAIQNPLYNKQLWDLNGGWNTRKSYNQAPYIYENMEQWILEVPMSHRDFFYRQQLHVSLEIEGVYDGAWRKDDYLFTHAPIPKREYLGLHEKPNYIQCDSDASYLNKVLADNDSMVLTWSCHHDMGVTEEEYAMRIPGKFHVIGHIHALMFHLCNVARIYDHIAYVDAGCGCHETGQLCAIELPSKKLYYI